jgi:flagellar biogenesis protein FliO
VVVTVGEKHYLLGLSPEGIRLLTPIDPPRDPSPSASTALDPSAEKRG